jgi:signal transduction histidine kinase
LEAVFVRFLQVAANDRRGVGLGLYISKAIVQGHGGRIWAESQIGRGSTFCFTLPTHVAD